ncbi:SDR family oxidoreductase [Rhodobacteraceae bacterium 2CG4]|uniref:SDR family oxidoreductase n=1 Tax=Halovulum marinum TaxID=2662447 RepID=A0A6L5Z4E7_9RHOB|nr:SDR family oxidoreductase [Halovulum marinum]MSU91327.1 SDR family oxidoreductase [Halovulum marinum]
MTPDNPPPIDPDRMPAPERGMEPAPDYHPRHPGVGKLKDQVALVTGGDSGIGRAVAVLFAREGADVAIAYYDEDRDAEDTAAAIRDEGREALLIAGDLGEREHAFEAVRATVERFGKLDILVNNAAMQFLDAPFEEMDATLLRRMLESNILSAMYCTQAALPHLENGGRIVNTTSVTAFKGSGGLVGYSTTRGATLAFTRSLSKQAADRGIRINAVAPGPIWTPFIPGSFPPDAIEDFGKDTALGRPGQPWEVATSYLFLASSDGSYFHGQTLHPNGGTVVNA